MLKLTDTNQNLPSRSPDGSDIAIPNFYQLDDFDRILLKHIAEYPDLKMTQISKILNAPVNMIRNRKNRPCFKLALEKLTQTTEKDLAEAAKKAARKLIELIDHDNPAIALAAVKIALTRQLNTMPESTKERIIAFKTTIEADGNLLQEIVKEEISGHIIQVAND
jgi:hypothetical protein